MSTRFPSEKIQKLQRVALAATAGPWEQFTYLDEKWNEQQYGIQARAVADATDASQWPRPIGTIYWQNAVWLTEEESAANAEFVATFDPVMVLEMLKELEGR